MTNTNNITPFEATHPGVLLHDEIKSRGIKQNDLSLELGILPTFLNEIIKGKRPITADFAILLEKSLGIPAEFWMRFQSQYDIDRAKIKDKNIQKIELIEIWNIIKEYVPIKYFKKLGYLTDSLKGNIELIKVIYQVSNIESLVKSVEEHRTVSFYRKSEKLSVNEVNMLAWSKLAEYEAKKMIVSNFNVKGLSQLKLELQKVFFENIDVKIKSKKKLMEFGIKLIYLEKFDKTPLDGFSFWSEKNPAIAMTIRHNRIDNFAFTIFHELGHIELHLQEEKERQFIDIYGSNRKDIYEKQANEYAQKTLISDSLWNDFKNHNLPFDDIKIIDFGNKYFINPAIILGRICWEKDNYAFKSKIDRRLGK